MAKFEVELPDGLITVEANDEYEAYQKALNQTRQAAAAPRQQEVPETWGGVAKQAVGNIPQSAGNLVSGLYEAVTNPVQTAKTVLDIGAGALQALLPESVVNAIGKDEKSQEVFKQVGQFYLDRYGSEQGIKKAIAQDPVGVLADASSILYGGGAALRGTSALAGAATGGRATLAPVQAAGQALSAAGSMIDPLAATARGVAGATRMAGKVAAPVLGMSTGAGAESIRQAFSAGREGGEQAAQFRANIAGKADQFDVLNAAKQNLDQLRMQKSDAYRSGMVNVKNDKSILSFNKIDQELNNAAKRTQFKGKVVDQTAADALSEVANKINEWKALDPANYHTPEGLDALKQSVGAVLDGLEPRTNAYNTVNKVYNSIKSEITKQAPAYANTMREYSAASDQIKEIEKALSLGDKASADTAMRKLQSLMRDNVNTNFGTRVRLGKELEQQGGQMMMPGIAGQALQSLAPSGIQRATAIPTGGLSYLAGGVPAAVASGLMSSPRIVGEASYAAGLGARGIDTAKRLPFLLDPEIYNLLYQTGEANRIKD